MEQPQQNNISSLPRDVLTIIGAEAIRKPKYTPFTALRSVSKQFKTIVDRIDNPALYEVPLHVILDYMQGNIKDKHAIVEFIVEMPNKPIKEGQIPKFTTMTWDGVLFQISQCSSSSKMQFYMNILDVEFIRFQLENMFSNIGGEMKYILQPLVWYSIMKDKPNCNKVRLLVNIRQRMIHLNLKYYRDAKENDIIDTVVAVQNPFSWIRVSYDTFSFERWMVGSLSDISHFYILWVLEDVKHTEELIEMSVRFQGDFSCRCWELARISYPPNLTERQIKDWILEKYGLNEEKHLSKTQTDTLNKMIRIYRKIAISLETERLLNIGIHSILYDIKSKEELEGKIVLYKIEDEFYLNYIHKRVNRNRNMEILLQEELKIVNKDFIYLLFNKCGVKQSEANLKHYCYKKGINYEDIFEDDSEEEIQIGEDDEYDEEQ